MHSLLDGFDEMQRRYDNAEPQSVTCSECCRDTNAYADEDMKLCQTCFDKLYVDGEG